MQYPFYDGDVRLAPDPSDYVPVEDTPPPSIDRMTQYLYEEMPLQINGVWKRIWVVADCTEAQKLKKIENMRRAPPEVAAQLDASNGAAPDVIA